MKTPNRQTVIVRERVDVTLNCAEVEHCLRCWLDQKLAPIQAPKPKSFIDVAVTFDIGSNEHHEPVLRRSNSDLRADFTSDGGDLIS